MCGPIASWEKALLSAYSSPGWKGNPWGTSRRLPPKCRPAVPKPSYLVEDEPMVRRLARTVLQDAGYRVLDAGEGDEASSFAREHRNSIHLLVTDVVMPRMSGPELAGRLVRECRGMKVAPGFAFLQKSFSPVALAAKVREVLDTEKTRKIALPAPSKRA